MSTGVKTHRITDPNDDQRFVDVDPYVIEGIAKWGVNHNQSSNSIRSSINTSSFSDNGTGDVTFTVTNNFASTNVTVNATTSNTFPQGGNATNRSIGGNADTVGGVRLVTFTSDSAVLVDVAYVGANADGLLA